MLLKKKYIIDDIEISSDFDKENSGGGNSNEDNADKEILEKNQERRF